VGLRWCSQVALYTRINGYSSKKSIHRISSKGKYSVRARAAMRPIAQVSAFLPTPAPVRPSGGMVVTSPRSPACQSYLIKFQILALINNMSCSSSNRRCGKLDSEVYMATKQCCTGPVSCSVGLPNNRWVTNRRSTSGIDRN
jgi:hypothetical protein